MKHSSKKNNGLNCVADRKQLLLIRRARQRNTLSSQVLCSVLSLFLTVQAFAQGYPPSPVIQDIVIEDVDSNKFELGPGVHVIEIDETQ